MAVVKRTGIEGSSHDPKLEIDLKELFGRDIPSNFSQSTAIGQKVIDIIRERTEEGKFLNASSTKKYDKDYKESFDYKRYGKSPGEKPNLNLSGKMLRSLDILETSGDKIVIGWKESEQAAKAHGHITGGGMNNSLPKRDFFDLTKSEINQIKEEFERSLPGTENQDSSTFSTISAIFSSQVATTEAEQDSSSRSVFSTIRDLFTFNG